MGRAPRTLTWATFAGASGAPMGLQHYELQVLSALAELPAVPWDFKARNVASVRADVKADVRLPLGLLGDAPTWAARAAGRWAYRGASFVHRFDLRLPPATVPEVVTVHDLPPLRFPDEGSLPKWALETAGDARLVICPSEFAAAEVRELLGVERVVVIPYGIAEAYRSPRPPSPAELLELGIDSPFVLHAAGATRRKNLEALAGAWRIAGAALPELSLVLVGPPDARRDRAFSGLPRVIRLGYRRAPDVASLMAAARFVVVPSMYEGFGLPAVEAMAAGTATVAARAGALPEVCGDAALLAEPDAEGLASAIVRLVQDDELRTRLVAAGREWSTQFTWERAARAHLAAYEAAFG